MAKGINRVILIGNLGQDVELRQFPQGGSVASTTLATSESWKDKQTGEQKEVTEWHRLAFNNRLAEIASQYLRKGSKIYVEGSLRTRKWQNQQGQDQYTTEIRVHEMQMLDGKPQQQNQGYQQQNQGFQQQAHQNQFQAQQPQGQQQQPSQDFDPMEDIPF